jgi:penicillin-binding protein 1B
MSEIPAVPLPPAPARRRPRRRWILLAIPIFLAIVLVGFIGSCVQVKIPSSGSRQTVVYYTSAADLHPGARMNVEDLEGRLHRLGYREVDEPRAGGEYAARGRTFEIWLRPFRYPERDFPGGRVRLRIDEGEIGTVEARDDLEEEDLRLEPERIAGFEGEIGAFLEPIRLADAPPLLAKAVVAVEDRRFYQHIGIDPIGTVRAAWVNVRGGERRQGGSTLTQQLARSLFLHNRRTFARKIREAVLALALEMRYSKEEILEAYLTAVSWGTWGSMEIRGAREASRYYLGKELEEADAAGVALLVGLIQAPNAHSPYASAEKARRRRDLVLEILERQGILTEKEASRAQAAQLPSKKPPDRIADAAYFLDAARKEVEERAPGGTLDRRGLSIFTTLDPSDQATAVAAVREGAAKLERDHKGLRRKKQKLQAAAVVVDPASGEVRALVGGRSYLESPFNRAIEAQRQPGSLFKPFVYLAAFQNPKRKDGTFWTAATIVKDEPIEIPAGRTIYRPQNYDREYRGEVTVRTALEKSLNVPTAAVGHEVGIKNVVSVAHELGIRSKLQEVPSLALGASEVNLLEITSAYATLAAGGEAHAPRFVRGILTAEGRPIRLDTPEDAPGVEPQEAYLLTRLLQGVIDEGTGAKARSLGVEGAAAGKTGTTDDFRDAWFVGYTPKRAAGVWVGFDRTDVTGLSGASAALPIWAKIMSRIEVEGGDGPFERPTGIVTIPICPESGELATGDCPVFQHETFIEGTEPLDECLRHRGFITRVRRFFGI